ncbi:MAG: hypothetical protein Q9M34_03710, partial [Sulfurimonas sp.]|nr:hypothetical protein [Sulfurimonas sp.]
KFLKFLKKQGLKKEPNQTMANFLREAQKELGISFLKLNTIYNKLKYKKEPQDTDFLELKKEIKRLKAEIKKSSR